MPVCPVSRIGHSIDYYTLLVQNNNEEIDESSEESSEDTNYLTILNNIDMAQLSAVIRGTWENKYGDKMTNIWHNLCPGNITLDYSKSNSNEASIQQCSSIINNHKDKPDPNIKYNKMNYILLYGGIITDNNDNFVSSNSYTNTNLSQTSVDTFLKASNWTACDQLFICSLNNFKQNWQLLDCNHGLTRRAFHSTCVVYALQGIPITFLFGGLTDKDRLADNNLYYMQLFDDPKLFKKWSELQIDGIKPQPRYGHTLRCIKHYLILFGGIVDNQLSNDVWVLNLNNINSDNNKWEQIYFHGLTPSPRSFHSAISVGKANYSMLIYGGISKYTNRNRIYALCITADGKWFWKLFPVIVKFTNDVRAFHTMHIIDKSIIIIGGEDYSKKKSIGLHTLIYCMREKTFFYRSQVVPMAGHVSWVTNSLIHSFGGFVELSILPPGVVTFNPLGYGSNNMVLGHYFRLGSNEEVETKIKTENIDMDTDDTSKPISGDSNKSVTMEQIMTTESSYVQPVVTYAPRPQRSSAFKAMQAIKEDMEIHKIAENDKETREKQTN